MQASRQAFVQRLGELRRWTDELRGQVLQNGAIGIERERLARAALTILAVASFEGHLRELVRAFIQAVAHLAVPFAQLPASMQRCHLEGGAQHLIATVKREVRASRGATKQTRAPLTYSDAHTVSQRLSSTAQGVPYELVWEAFADTGSNPGPETVSTILKRLDVDKPWQTIAVRAANPYPEVVGAARVGFGGGMLEAKLVEDLRELLHARNRCAHGIIDSAVPALSSLVDYVAALDAVSDGITTSLIQRHEAIRVSMLDPDPPSPAQST